MIRALPAKNGTVIIESNRKADSDCDKGLYNGNTSEDDDIPNLPNGSPRR